MPKVKIRGSEFDHTLSPPALVEARSKIEAALVAEQALHQKMIAAAQSGAPNYDIEAEYLSSQSILLACAVRAGAAAKLRRPTVETLLEIPEQHSLDKAINEVDWVHLKSKSGSKKYRFVHDFGPRLRTLQMAVRRVVESHFVPRPFQFTFGGIQGPIVQAKEAILAGNVHFATLDIENHFGSFHETEFASLLYMLPQAWIERAVSGQSVVMKWKRSSNAHLHQVISPPELLTQARSGILTGAISSPIIAARSLSKLCWMHHPAGLWNYADNFLLLTTTFTQLKNNIEELKARVSELPGGHFALKLVSEGTAAEGFEFLGHRVTLNGKKIQTEPSAANQSAILGDGYGMGCRVRAAMKDGQEAMALGHVEKYCARVKGWLSAFSLCDDIANWKAVMEFGIEQEAWPLVVDARTMLAAANGDFKYRGGEYQYVQGGEG